MTYLQLINKVLRELREKTVTDLAAEYTNLIGQFVNEAKEEVERAWTWKALRTDVTFNTVSGTQDYNLGTAGVGSGGTTTDRSKLVYNDRSEPQVFITTEGSEGRLTEVPRERHKETIAYGESGNQSPSTFSLKRESTGITMSIYPKPDGVYAVQATFYIPQAELAAVGTTISVPSGPVWKQALAYAASERGGGMGEQAQAVQRRADLALWAAITDESESGELTFYEE